eukprot:741932-Hanusia_phi.AAC.1
MAQTVPSHVPCYRMRPTDKTREGSEKSTGEERETRQSGRREKEGGRGEMQGGRRRAEHGCQEKRVRRRRRAAAAAAAAAEEEEEEEEERGRGEMWRGEVLRSRAASRRTRIVK